MYNNSKKLQTKSALFLLYIALFFALSHKRKTPKYLTSYHTENMAYSNKMAAECRTYMLTPQQVAFCHLMADGFSKTEAAAIIFNKVRETEAAAEANRVFELHPNALRLIDNIQQERANMEHAAEQMEKIRKRGYNMDDLEGIDAENNDNENITGMNENELNEVFTTKYGVLTEYQKLLRGRVTAKDRIAILGKIADLQQLKREESKEVERVHYYLPLRCSSCSLFQAAEKRSNEHAGL